MIILNFSHPLTPEHRAQIEARTGERIAKVIDVDSQIDPQQPLAPQVTALADRADLSPSQWQTEQVLINPPSLNVIAVALVAELHGRMGYFPACLRLCPVPDTVPPRFEVAEILDLREIRDSARRRTGR